MILRLNTTCHISSLSDCVRFECSARQERVPGIIKSICRSLNKKHPQATGCLAVTWTSMVHTAARQLGNTRVVWPGDKNQMLFSEYFLLVRRWSVHGVFGALGITIMAVLPFSSARLGHSQAAECTEGYTFEYLFSNSHSQSPREVHLCWHKPGITCLISELELYIVMTRNA